MAAVGFTMDMDVKAPDRAGRARPPRQRNQRITFARTPDLAGELIRATARGPVDGFGTARVIDFRPEPESGRFRGAWQLTFPAGTGSAGTIRYVFTGRTSDRSPAATAPGASVSSSGAVPVGVGRSVPWPTPAALRSRPATGHEPRSGGRQLVRIGRRELVPASHNPTDASSSLVEGTFELLGGTGRFAHVVGRGVFQGWAMSGLPVPPYLDGDVD